MSRDCTGRSCTGNAIWRLWLVSLVAVLLTIACSEQNGDWNVRLVNSQGKSVALRVAVAQTEAERAKGLSGLSELPMDGGMLFVFPDEGRVPFWMKDTLVPLSIAFVDASGRIVDIQDMQPLSEDLHVASADFMYALEMEQGFFARLDIKEGDLVTLRLDKQ